MTDIPSNIRKDTGSRVIKASPEVIYNAFLSREAIAAWRPPEGMKATIYTFDPSVGGTYRMSFGYKDKDHEVRGKTSENEDVFTGRFTQLVPGERIVEEVNFESDDPSFAGTMKITTTLEPVPGGTRVTFTAENVPPGIRPEDHQKGMTSTLENLAKYTEGPTSAQYQ